MLINNIQQLEAVSLLSFYYGDDHEEVYMVVLNFYGTIAPICISKKLGLYISNLPNTKHNEWRDDLAEELELAVKADIIYQDKLGTNFPCGFQRLYHNLFPDVTPPSTFTKETPS